MPQMAPMMWLTLFMWFSLILVTFAIMNYYSFFPLTSPSIEKGKSYTNNSLDWSW
uniref:ATP synthase complex subunit 8 n=1 Tax=Mirhipipteryx andensis TaxID=1564103 RepID=A0A0N6WAF2_9ORTH|nr:ATP synthase F0 subunit 8 [Mirhipipteryx andensis]AJW76423.1 ATP synthase F0 subunit 8 [Mirhipipteryx andensis]